MHIFDYSFLKDDLLPAQLVTYAANISTLKVMTSMRRNENAAVFRQLESIARIESVNLDSAVGWRKSPLEAMTLRPLLSFQKRFSVSRYNFFSR